MVTSTSDIVVKPIQAFRPATPDPNRASSSKDAETQSGTSSKRGSQEDIFGRPAGLELPRGQGGNESKHSQDGAMAAFKGSASGVGGFFKHFSKGMLLDLPYAVTEGMRNAPNLYGGKAYNPGAVTDWKSGGVAAGKNFAHGIVEGFGGIVMEPIRGGKEGGAAGAAKGVGIGLLNMGTKVTSGAMGLVALPGQGLYQSARALVKRKTMKSVMEARKAEGVYEVENGKNEQRRTVVDIFDGMGR